MIRMQCRVRVKDVWGHCMHMFPYNYLHFDQNENCNFSRVRLKMINGLVDHSNVSRTALRKLLMLMLMRRSRAAKNYVKSESGAQQNKAENIAVCWNQLTLLNQELRIFYGKADIINYISCITSHTADIFLISHPPVPSSLFKLASAWGKIYCVTCLTNYSGEVASRDYLLKQPLLFPTASHF